uniref:Uncharacterized protein n=1 Tax=Micrurus lemniscatus lemniscatus TaxID=129467 RepID=A0A2D4JJ17_MICLE
MDNHSSAYFQIWGDMGIVLIEKPSTESGWPLESISSSKDPSLASQVFETSCICQSGITVIFGSNTNGVSIWHRLIEPPALFQADCQAKEHSSVIICSESTVSQCLCAPGAQSSAKGVS